MSLVIGTSEGLFTASLDDARPSPRPLELGTRIGALRGPMVIDRDDPDRRFIAALRGGVLRSTDGGRSWAGCNRGLAYTEVWHLAQQPGSGDLFAGTGPVALFRSRDGGEEWEELEDLTMAPFRADWFCHVAPYHPRVRGLTFSDADPGVLFGAVEEGWVFRTTDDGKSWDNPRQGLGQDVHMVALPPGDPGAVLCATGTGLYRSGDGGASFDLLEEVPAPYVTTLLTHRASRHLIYATASLRLPRDWRPGKQGAGFRVLRSDDDGRSWRLLEEGWPSFVHAGCHGAAALDPADPDDLVIGLSDGTIWRTGDGEHFSCVIEGLPNILSLARAAG